MHADIIKRLEDADALDIALFKSIMLACAITEQDNVWWRVLKLVECGAFLDAAVALVERVLPGWRHAYEKRTNGIILAWVSDADDEPCIPETGPNPAIALLLALFRALAARARQESETPEAANG